MGHGYRRMGEDAKVMTTEHRILAALMLGRLTRYQLSSLLSMNIWVIRRYTQRLHHAGCIRVASFEHRSCGAPRPRYALSPTGLSIAKELLREHQ